MDNSDRMKRVDNLISDISSTQTDAETNQQNFKNTSDLAYGALQGYLKAHNMATTDDLINEAIRQLSPAEQEKIKNRMKELTPPTGINFFLQPSEIAKFFLYGYGIRDAWNISNAAYLNIKAYYINAKANTLLGLTKTGKGVYPIAQSQSTSQAKFSLLAFTAEGAAIIELGNADRQLLMKEVQNDLGALHTELDQAMDLGMNNQAWQKQMQVEDEILKVEKAVAKVKQAGAADAEALAAAAKFTTWTKVLIVANVVAIAGLIFYENYKEKQVTTELQGVIKKLVVARLYAKMAEKMELVHVSQQVGILMLVNAYAAKPPQDPNPALDAMAQIINSSLKDITEENTWDTVKKFDDNRYHDEYAKFTAEDPDLTEIKKIRAEDAEHPIPGKLVKPGN
ncbi:hypothetical protein BP6252_13825 [Coleophoma cylindrospora]|uniref:Uncharacterized protein n=1 Tax=Coleophoma cylindrospora TaxID=1849047 RepID=A0A3D8Q666_9HELO|nr:hypothetical protein BP6252_13825 [Coleophoma cylindrospora]